MTTPTDEMKAERVQLVLPRSLHPTYTAAQQVWLMDVESFTRLVKQRQNA
ncbi:type II restriction endonuclease [Falsochrobactrum ovis]